MPCSVLGARCTTHAPCIVRVVCRFVGSEHGLVHDGLQADGYIELRLDWRTPAGEPKIALIKCVIAPGRHVHAHPRTPAPPRPAACSAPRRSRDATPFVRAIGRCVPWLAYGCGEGARVGVRKPGATEGTSSTVQRGLRDDTVVVKRDGTDNELTVDPTPFTVVPASNPRILPGTRILILHEGSAVDALVEPWPEAELDIKEGSRHCLKARRRTRMRMPMGAATMRARRAASC